MMSSTSTVLLYQNIHSNFHVPIEPCCSRDSAGAANFLSCRISTGCKIRAQNPLALNMDKSLDNPGVIAFPPLIWLVNAVISVLLHLFIRLPIMRYSACLVCGFVWIFLVLKLALWVLKLLNAAARNVNPAKPTLTIVRSGPFRFTRNPMYLALCLVQIALGFFLNDWITLLFVAPLALIMHYGVILREERYLTDKFGEPYLELKREVRRWL